MSLVTVNNLYENGVCDEFTIYTGTTYNGDPYIIPVSAQSIGSHSLPHTFDVGGYEGPLYIFLVHCDFYVTPPPSETPKRQGGFQVKLINIDCENCPPFSPVATPSPTSTPNATPTTDCNFTVNFVEYSPQPTPNATPQPTPNPSATPNSTPNPSPSPTEGPCVCIEFSHNSTGTRYYGYDDCSGVPQTGTTYTQETFSVCGSGQNITVSDPKLSYSIGSDCVEGICPSPNDPTPTPSATPQPTPDATPQPTTEANPPTNQNIIIKGFVSGSETGSSFPVYDGQGPIGEYNIPQGSGKVHSIYNGSDETIYVRLMAKTYSGSNQSFDAMAKIVYSNTTQDIGDQIYVGIQGGTQNANYQSTISSGNPAYGGSQWVIEIPPIGTRTAAVGIHPSYYSTDGENVSYTFAWSLNESFVRSEQNEITTYVA